MKSIQRRRFVVSRGEYRPRLVGVTTMKVLVEARGGMMRLHVVVQ